MFVEETTLKLLNVWASKNKRLFALHKSMYCKQWTNCEHSPVFSCKSGSRDSIVHPSVSPLVSLFVTPFHQESSTSTLIINQLYSSINFNHHSLSRLKIVTKPKTECRTDQQTRVAFLGAKLHSCCMCSTRKSIYRFHTFQGGGGPDQKCEISHLFSFFLIETFPN